MVAGGSMAARDSPGTAGSTPGTVAATGPVSRFVVTGHECSGGSAGPTARCGGGTLTPMGVLDRFRLDGRIALITGASRGIGLTLARGLGEAGATVVLNGATRAG